MKQTFNPQDWLQQPAPQTIIADAPKEIISTGIKPVADTAAIEAIIQQIETNRADITGDYKTWRDIGFALSDALGESGREYFHRISKFHPSYTPAECDAQFTNCLKANGH